MALKPEVPKGFSDTGPGEMLEIERIQAALRESYRTFGFLPLDTPAVEYREVLTGSESGVAGDNQIYTVANIDYRRAQPVEGRDGQPQYSVKPELGLRFDLTVPLARYVAKNGRKLSFPFKRYQIAKVWRGERPQKGRFREFIQCDVDTISNGELTPYDDAEALACANDAFERLGITDHYFKVNNRRAVQELLTASVGHNVDSEAVLRVLDKREKVGDGKVVAELKSEAGIASPAATALLKQLDAGYQKGLSNAFDRALDELTEYVEIAVSLGVPRERMVVDPSLARGLGYYTGNVVETLITGGEQFGSVCSGGRYDNLTGSFVPEKKQELRSGKKSERYPGTGLSIGLSRLQEALRDQRGEDAVHMRELDLYLGVLSPDVREQVYPLVTKLRAEGISVVCNPNENRIKKIFKNADASACRYALFFGEDEAASRSVTIKDIETGEQTDLTFTELAPALKRLRKSRQ